MKAKEILIKLLPIIFTPSLVPSPVSNLNLTQDKATPESFIVTWNTPQASIGGILTLNQTNDNITTIYLSMLKVDQKDVSIEVAQTITPQFFSITPQGKWACKTLKNETYCENFWEESGIKRGMGVQGPMKLLNNQTGLGVFFCQFTPTSRQYEWQSCTAEFVKTGVK